MKTPQDRDQMHNTKDLMRLLKVSRITVYRWVAAGMPHYQPFQNSNLLFNLNEVKSWMIYHGNKTHNKLSRIRRISNV